MRKENQMKQSIILITLLAALLLLGGCGRRLQTVRPAEKPGPTRPPEAQPAPTQEPQQGLQVPPSATGHPAGKYGAVEGEELLCLVENEEEAKAVAAQYGIELINCSYGVATFHTDRNPSEVIEEGLKNGWKELSINGYKELYN